MRGAEKRRTAKKRAAEKASREKAPFIAIDAEGGDVGAAFEICSRDETLALDLGLPENSSKAGPLICQDHRTFLWGACVDDGDPTWLGGRDKRPLPSTAICDWLVSLPTKFPHAIFVMFAAGYDWTQIFRDMEYEKAWELWSGFPWSEHDNPTGRKPNRRRFVLWREFGLQLYPGKYLQIGKFRDRNQIRNEKGELDFESKIKIYDTFGFFQSSFLKAAKGFGGSFLRGDELKILENGKSRRGEFSSMPLPEIMRYTAVELRVLARMMGKLREGLKASDLSLRNWNGAGCIAQTMIRNDHISEYYPHMTARIDIDDRTSPDALALRTYFGGRVEMIKQGVHNSKFWNYDISSAYPHILRQLPNMRNGQWRVHGGDELMTSGAPIDYRSCGADPSETLGVFRMAQYARSVEQLRRLHNLLEAYSLVSMARMKFYFPACHRRIFSAGRRIIAKADHPWFPLPIRADDGAIYFPRYGEGVYMVEEARAMLRWTMRVYADAKTDELPLIALLEAFEFIPASKAKPFKNRVEKDFAERARIVEETGAKRRQWEASGKEGPEPYDVREKVLKLGLNSLYGKTAQSKGGRIKRDDDGVMRAYPPKEANPYYAAAVTAGTRAMLLDAASADPDAVILFATDGICSVRELPDLDIPAKKTLGTWERSVRKNGVFVKAGIYTHEAYEDAAPDDSCGADKIASKPVNRSTKMRGIRPSSLPAGMTAEQWIVEEVPRAWGRDDPSLTFPYTAYKTVGSALASRASWKLAGHWIKGEREADIQRVSAKRDCRGMARESTADGSERPGEKQRQIALFDTAPAENPLGWKLSRPYNPEWIDGELEKRVRAEDEQKTLGCKGGFGFERD